MRLSDERDQILANAPAAKSAQNPGPGADSEAAADAGRETNARQGGALLTIATSRWFLFAALPMLLLGTAGIFAVTVEGQGAGKQLRDVGAMLAAAGETLDLESFYPEPVPDGT